MQTSSVVTHILAALAGVALFAEAAAQPSAPASQPAPIVIDYAEAKDPGHVFLRDLLKERQSLERVRDLLAPLRWPRTLRLETRGCDGDVNAYYEDAVITICYEYAEDIWRNANSSRRPADLSVEDAFAGPLVDTFLHEASHAVFDLFKVPVLGREEDAADQIAAYHVLQLSGDKKRRLVMGGAYGYLRELRASSVRDLTRPRLRFGRHVSFADEHGTPAQRLYNLLCIAYGSDKILFADVVERGYLPQERAEMCEDEYKQVDRAYRQLIMPLLGDAAPAAADAAPRP